MYFKFDDFIIFCNHLQAYLDTDLIEDKNTDKEFPVGRLTNEFGEIHIYFMHYHSFNEAKDKWNERKKRVDYEKIYVIAQIEGELDEDKVQKFNSIPYKNKVLLSKSPNNRDQENIIYLRAMNRSGYMIGDVLHYKTMISVKRQFNEFDYISFLNK